MPLRDYQERAVTGINERLAAGCNPLLIAPTGSGKTRMLSAILQGRSAVALAHRRELVTQMRGEFHPSIRVDTWQSLARRAPPYADLLVVDEAHHVAHGTGYERLILAMRSVNPRLQVLGATATPWRLDGKGLTADGLFDDYVVAATPAELLASGVLVPYVGFAYQAIDTTGVRRVGGDYSSGQLAEAAVQPRLMGAIVDRWRATASTLSTLVFAVNVAHAHALCDEFKAQGVHAEMLTGHDADSRRMRLFRDLRERRLPVLINVAVATEGVDIPSLECLVLARPTLSECLALQMLGRVLRSAPGKTRARIHDHAQVLTHGSPFAERDWSPRADRKRGEAGGGGSQQVCVECLALIPASCRTCPECGAVLKERAAVEPGDGIEVAISSDAPPVRRWEPQSVGDSVEGVVGVDFLPPDYVDLTAKLKRLPVGARVRATYNGMLRTAKGRLMKRFDVITADSLHLSPRELELLNAT